MDELTCPITQDLMWDPVTVECGHRFGRHAVANWLRTKNTCPTCRRVLTHKNVCEDFQLRARVRTYARENNIEEPTHTSNTSSASRMTRRELSRTTHHEILSLEDELHKAAKDGNEENVRVLLVAGVDVNAKGNFNRTPLHVASFYGHASIVKMLIRAGADVNAKDNNNWTPLFWASRHGRTSVVKMLICVGADVNAKDDVGWMSLHVASVHGYVLVVEELIRANADVNAKNDEGWTSLHVASVRGHASVVEELIRADADVNAKNKDNATPLRWASFRGHAEVVRLLRENGARNNKCTIC